MLIAILFSEVFCEQDKWLKNFVHMVNWFWRVLNNNLRERMLTLFQFLTVKFQLVG